MANPTTNYGWVMPTATDLVTDLPADFAVFGQAVDTSMADLKGGTTGQVLAKASNTDMDFVWSADAAGMTNPMTTTGDTIYSSPGSTPVRRAIGTTGQVLTVAGGIPTWATPAGASFKGCSLQLTSSVGVANGTQTTVDFTTEIFDTDAFHDNSTNPSRITIPTGLGGKYLLIGASGWANATSATDRGIRITKNGSVSGLPQVNWQTSASGIAYMNIATVVTGVATDYYQVEVIQYNGTSLVLQSATTFFQAIYLGA